jgi:glucose dehydrogenase
VVAALAPLGAYAQSAVELAKCQNDMQRMGYDLQRYSKLTKINKDNVKKLVQRCGAS